MDKNPIDRMISLLLILTRSRYNSRLATGSLLFPVIGLHTSLWTTLTANFLQSSDSKFVGNFGDELIKTKKMLLTSSLSSQTMQTIINCSPCRVGRRIRMQQARCLKKMSINLSEIFWSRAILFSASAMFSLTLPEHSSIVENKSKTFFFPGMLYRLLWLSFIPSSLGCPSCR